MKQILNGKIYDTDTASVVTSNYYWDGSNWDREGRNTYLYKTKKGNFFLYHITRWEGEHNQIVPLDIEKAKEYFEKLPAQNMSYKWAFSVEPEEA